MNSESKIPTTLFVAPWGDFTKYDETSYIPPGTDQEVRSKTSLIPLINHVLNSVDSYDETRYEILILVQETLAATLLSSELDGLHNEDKEYSEAYKKVLNNLEKEVFENINELDFPKHPTIKILPGIGSFSYNKRSGNNGKTVTWRFNKNIEKKATPFGYYASIALLHILSTLYKVGGNCKSAIHIHFDSTHGINYTGTATYRALLTAARLYSASTDSTIEMSFYNSDPYIRGVNRPLHIWNVRNEYITPKKALSQLLYTYILVRSDMPGIQNLKYCIVVNNKLAAREKKDLEKESRWINELAEKYANKAFSGAYFGFPLLLLNVGYECHETLLDKKKAMEDVFNTIIDIFVKKLPIVKVQAYSDGSLIIEHQAGMLFDKLKSYLAGLSAINYSVNTWKEVFGETCRKEHDTNKSRNVLWATYRDLEKTEDRIVGPLRQIVSHELYQFKKILEGSDTNDISVIYMDFVLKLKQCLMFELERYINNSIKEQIINIGEPKKDLRIFTAHAGLSTNLLSIKCKGNTIYVAYNKQAIENILEDIAKDLLNDVKKKLILVRYS
ncbi:MAG: CRISPR-associated DxTHG motif protein [Desulfurococcales archaeon]|nr:CRISPR-associated DxTHG motif protein [Desulfurococcales archaeon]